MLEHVAEKRGRQSSALNRAGRKLLLRDGLVFLTLTLISLVLYGVTLILFRAFERHRENLAAHWADRGRDEMQHGHAENGAASLRNALSYDPDNRDYELLLAQALSDSGQTEQATNYFLSLRDLRPGDGFINLQLARIARSKGAVAEAVNDYHASVFGDWAGDGLFQRRSVRLELADYLISQHQLQAARAELLIAAGNAPNDSKINLAIGDRFAAIEDSTDALTTYKKAAAFDPQSQQALEAIGRLFFQAGSYEEAHAFLKKALRLDFEDQSHKERVEALASEAEHLLQLSFSRDLPARERAEHLLVGKAIAEARLQACTAQQGTVDPKVSALQALETRWKAAHKYSVRQVQQDATMQDGLANLINDTEVVTAKECGQPSGNDALLLKVALR